MSKTLFDTCDSIECFIFEAEECARQKMGFAAMSTIFAVVLSVSEAVGHHTRILSDFGDKNLIGNFVHRMGDKTWLVPQPTSSLSDENIATELYHIRNGIAHQLSLPNYIGLINTRSEVKEFLRENPHIKRALCVIEFVAVVKATVAGLIKSYPQAILDPNPQGSPRSPAKRVTLPSGTSGSPPSYSS